LVLALLTLPFPWLEVRCNSRNVQPQTHYSQTGLQILAGRSTVLTPPPAPAAQQAPPPPAPAPPAAPPAPGRPGAQVNPFRQAIAWLWLVCIVAGVAVALAGRTFALALLNLIFSASAALLVLVLLGVVAFEEAFNSVSFTNCPLLAFLLCLAATGGGIA